MKKKILYGILILLASLAMVGCGKSNELKEASTENDTDFPNKSIKVIVPWSAGGGSDLTVRTLMPYVEKELGVSTTVVNTTGANGWIAWTELANSDPDGYTIAQLNIPAFYPGYLDPQYKRDLNLDNFLPLVNEVSDWGCMVVKHGDERFKSAKDLIEYAKNNEILAGDNGVGTNKHLLTVMLNDSFDGLKITPVHQKGWSDTYAAILGGHIDVGWGSIGDSLQAVKDGELDLLCVFAPERSELIKDVPTFNELNLGAEILSPSDRGFVLPAGVNEKVYNKLLDAFNKAINNQEFIEKMNELGLDVKYIGGEEYQKYVKDQEQELIKYKDVMGWK